MNLVTAVAPMVASAGSTTSTVVDGDQIKTATSLIFQVVGQTLNEIVSNPVFLIFFVSGLVFMAVRIIRGLKRV